MDVVILVFQTNCYKHTEDTQVEKLEIAQRIFKLRGYLYNTVKAILLDLRTIDITLHKT